MPTDAPALPPAGGEAASLNVACAAYRMASTSPAAGDEAMTFNVSEDDPQSWLDDWDRRTATQNWIAANPDLMAGLVDGTHVVMPVETLDAVVQALHNGRVQVKIFSNDTDPIAQAVLNELDRVKAMLKAAAADRDGGKG